MEMFQSVSTHMADRNEYKHSFSFIDTNGNNFVGHSTLGHR